MTSRSEATPAAWQPIETAPKDGTWIIVYLATWKWPASKMLIVRWDVGPDGEGWHDDDDEDGPTSSPVTHWMPLPDPPERESNGSSPINPLVLKGVGIP